MGGEFAFRQLQQSGNGTEQNRTTGFKVWTRAMLSRKEVARGGYLLPVPFQKLGGREGNWDGDSGGCSPFFLPGHLQAPAHNGNGKAARSPFQGKHLGLLPPISEEQLILLVQMQCDRMVELYRKKLVDGQLTAKANEYLLEAVESLVFPPSPDPREAKFLASLKMLAMRFAQDRMYSRIRWSERVAAAEAGVKKRLESIDMEEARTLAAIGEKYRRVDTSLSVKVEDAGKPRLWEKIKKHWPKVVGVGIGGAITLLSTAFETMKKLITDIIEHIPVVSRVPPELIGVGAAVAALGMGLAIGGFKAALHKYREYSLNNLPRKEAKAKTEASEETEGKRSEAKEEAEKLRDWLERKCCEQQGHLMDEMRKEYRRLLSFHGYVSEN